MPEPRIGWDERDAIAAANRRLLREELVQKRLTLSSRPSRAHVQFSTFCNMSCVMCWDGRNPPLKKMAPPVLDRLAEQIAPGLSVITPHDGNEPLLVSWEETRTLAERYSVRLALTTNAQFLDEATFHEAKDVVEQFTLSVDSHVPEIYAKIRVGSKPETVFENVERVARLSAEHGVECVVQAVFMTPNAPMMPETVAYMAERGIQTVNVIAMVDANGHSGHLDPTLHFSAEWIEWVKQRCVTEAERGRIRLGWQLGGREWFDFRLAGHRTPPLPAKVRDREADDRFALLAPGFCRHAREGLRVMAGGEVTPCPMATGGQLRLGTLATQDFEEIWNGPTAQDLRRAHYTGDHPTLCASCRFTDPVGPQSSMPFLDGVAAKLGAEPDDFEPRLVAEDPAHMARIALDAPPVLRLSGSRAEGRRYVVAFGLGGDLDRVELCEPAAVRNRDVVELAVDEGLWERLATNLGWWWSVFELTSGATPVARSAEARCLIRHEHIPRVAGSTLNYPDDGRPAELYLGGARQIGFTARDHLPSRPPVRPKQDLPRRRFVHDLPGRLRVAVGEVVPEGADVLVVSKGYEQLLQLGNRSARHFPSDGDGRWPGYHPRDDEAAISHLEELRSAGATHLVIPAWALWWLDHYEGFAAHLGTHHRKVADVPGAGVIFELAADPTAELLAEADRTLGEAGQHRRFWERFHPGPEPDEALPRFATRASGYELVDSRGRTFVDWVCGGGPVILGYRHPAVEDAIRTQLEAGPTLSLPHPVQLDVAAMLIEMVPCAELVAFGKNGSDAVTAAVRLARAVTGRELILQYGVHGFHDWNVCARAGIEGVPKMLRALIRPFPYNDLAALAALFEDHPGEVAGIVMEPVAGALPQPGYLESVRDLAHEHGALLVFDEMVTGFRLANGGAQELYRVEPDLACFGKALSNGMPLSAVVGRRRYMERLPKVAFGMTFRGETLSLAAARAVLQTLRDEPVVEHVRTIGERVRVAFASACERHGVRGELRGPPQRMFFFFEDHHLVSGRAMRAAFLRECALNGVFTNGNFLPTYAHDDDAVERTAVAFDAAIGALRRLVRSADATVARAVRAGLGDPPRTNGHGPSLGHLDVVREGRDGVTVEGWLLAAGATVDSVELASQGGPPVRARVLERPDIAARFPEVDGAARAGFAATVSGPSDGRFDLMLSARRGDAVVFSCRIVRAGPPLPQPALGDDGTLHI